MRNRRSSNLFWGHMTALLKETCDCMASMSNPSLWGFCNIISLLDLVYADQSFADGIDMEYIASGTG